MREQACIVQDRPMPSAEVWMDGRLVVRESPIDGRGLFFTRTLAAGATVLRLGGRLVSSAELDALLRRAEADPVTLYVDTVTGAAATHGRLP
jgi:hypothetical protein